MSGEIHNPAIEAPTWLTLGWIRRTVALSALVSLLTGLISLVVPKSYRADAKLIPHNSGSSAASILSLAASSGLGDLLNSQAGVIDNPLLTYPEILKSRALLERVALSRYPAGGPPAGTTVMSALKIKETGRKAIDRAVRVLDANCEAEALLRSGLIRVSAVTGDSLLSAFIVQQMLDELNRFNLEARSSQSQATRQFIERRLQESSQTLEARERALASFREANVRIGHSPQLQLQETRLVRELETQSDLVRLLSREFESARIEERRDTPTFSVIDPPKPPVRHFRPRAILNALVGFFAMASIFLAKAILPRIVLPKS